MSESPDQLSLNIKLDDSVSLDKFIECDSNLNCLNFLRNTLKEDSVSNLFYIWGREGVGTVSYTHLTLPTTPYV